VSEVWSIQTTASVTQSKTEGQMSRSNGQLNWDHLSVPLDIVA